MNKIYVVTKMDDNYDVEILGAFFTHEEAIVAIKKNIFYFVSANDDLSYFETSDIPDFTYQIHETGIYDVELR